MIKPFVLLTLLLACMTALMMAHTCLFPYHSVRDTLLEIGAVINMAPLSLSKAYDESSCNMTYPEMPSLSRKPFIYEP